MAGSAGCIRIEIAALVRSEGLDPNPTSGQGARFLARQGMTKEANGTLTRRDKSILVGLYLSKFDLDGLRSLGFNSFIEAFNVIGSALGVRPASLKNYRDEFDPLFPNKRKGWHKRSIRAYCKAVYNSFGNLDLEEFTALLKRVVYRDRDLDVLVEAAERKEGEDRTFAKRLMTGQAAEQYFRAVYKQISLFKDLDLEDTTKIGCGFDFKLFSSNVFYGVEVKGLSEQSGSIALTSKEHAVASIMTSRFFLFVVKNFKENPFHELYQDPLNGKLIFNKVEQKTIQISWTAKI